MPKNLKQEIFFTLLMVPVMVIFMVTYNNYLVHGSFSAIPLKGYVHELIIMGIIAAVVEIPMIAPLAQKLAFSFINPRTCNPILIPITVSTCTVCMMCPFMSLMANAVLYNNISNLLIIWPRMIAINFPAALGWQLLIAGPLVRMVFNKCMDNKRVLAIMK